MRPIDISKKKNLKCEHCTNWVKEQAKSWDSAPCALSGTPKMYYQRCKQFAWRPGDNYITTVDGAIQQIEIGGESNA